MLNPYASPPDHQPCLPPSARWRSVVWTALGVVLLSMASMQFLAAAVQREQWISQAVDVERLVEPLHICWPPSAGLALMTVACLCLLVGRGE